MCLSLRSESTFLASDSNSLPKGLSVYFLFWYDLQCPLETYGLQLLYSLTHQGWSMFPKVSANGPSCMSIYSLWSHPNPHPPPLMSLSLSTQPPLSVMGARVQALSQLVSAVQQPSLRWILSILPSEQLLLCSPLKFWSSPQTPYPGLWVYRNFSSFTTPSLGCRSLSWNPLSLFLSLSFALPYSKEIGLPFWKPGVFCQHSEGVL